MGEKYNYLFDSLEGERRKSEIFVIGMFWREALNIFLDETNGISLKGPLFLREIFS